MTNEEKIEEAMACLHTWAYSLAQGAGVEFEMAELFWQELKAVPELLMEFAYFHDNGEPLCRYRVEGYSVADIMVWQIDHFRAHMDRIYTNNKTNREKLIYETFDMMLRIRKDKSILRRMEDETGTDLAGGWTVG